MGDPLVLGMIVAGFFLVIASMAFPRLVKNKKLAQLTSEAETHTHEVRALERVESRLLELEETSREIFGRLDTRARLMIRLIEEAEVKRQQLEEMVASRRGEA